MLEAAYASPTTGEGKRLARRLPQVLDQLLRRLRQRLEAAGADDKTPVGPGIPDPDHSDLHRARAAARRDLRHHGDADAGGHHLADGVEIVESRAEAQARAELCGVTRDMGMQCA